MHVRLAKTTDSGRSVPISVGFPDKRFQTLHDRLLEARNKIYAHKDLNWEGEHLPATPPKEVFQQIKIDILKSGVIEWNVSGPVLPKPYLKDVAALCEFQITRLNASSMEMLQHFCAQKSYSPADIFWATIFRNESI